MNDKIIIQTPSSAKDAAGQPVEGWTDFATLWGDVLFPSGAEAVRNGLVTSTVRASIRIHARTDISTGMRVIHKGVAYDIQSPLHAKDRRFMFIVCESAK